MFAFRGGVILALLRFVLQLVLKHSLLSKAKSLLKNATFNSTSLTLTTLAHVATKGYIMKLKPPLNGLKL